jgi:hypothetical protein
VVFAHACALGYEGIVSKRLGSRYRPGPNSGSGRRSAASARRTGMIDKKRH